MASSLQRLSDTLTSFVLKILLPLQGCQKDYNASSVKQTRNVRTLYPFLPSLSPAQESPPQTPNAGGIFVYITLHTAAVAAAVINPPAAVAPITPAVAACLANISSALGPCCTYIGR